VFKTLKTAFHVEIIKFDLKWNWNWSKS